MSESYRESDDLIRRRSSGYRNLNDTPAVREWLEAEAKRKAARKARKAAAVVPEKKAA